MRPNELMKRSQPEYSLSEWFNDDIKIVQPCPKKEKISEKPFSSESQSRLLCTEESLGEDDSADCLITLSRPKTPSPKKPQFPMKRSAACLEDFEEIIAWIIKNKQFFIASFSGELDKWVKNKIKTEPTFTHYLKVIEEFVDEFHNEMQAKDTVDVRKLHPDKNIESELFPDVYACFIDGVVGITDKEGRNTDVLSNSENNVLRVFLVKNKSVAECLAYGLPTLDKVAELWTKENAVRLSSTPTRSPQKSVLSPPKSPVGKSPNKSVILKIEKAYSKELRTKDTNLLANSMNSFLTHINSSGELRKPAPPPPSAPIKIRTPPLLAPEEPDMQRRQRVRRGPLFPKN